MTLGARVFAVGPEGERWIEVRDLFAGYYETILAPNELIAEVVIPPQTGRHAAYVKCTTLSADDWPALGVAASLKFEGATIAEASLAVSAATEKPTPLLRVAELVRGRRLDEATLREAGEAAVAEVDVLPDGRGSVAYKRQLLRVYVGRALRAAYEGAMGL
jgi:carbon-monoxide dehydrogenase medium subunit